MTLVEDDHPLLAHKRARNRKKEEAKFEEVPPVLLVDQDLPSPDDMPAPGKDWPALNAHLEQSLNAYRNWRTSYWTYCSTLAQYILPYRYRWLVTPNNMSRQGPINQTIVDPTGTQAMYRCAAGLWSALTSPTRPWFAIQADRPDDDPIDTDGQDWLAKTQRKVYDALGRSNFYTVMAQAFQDVTTFSTAPVCIYEDNETIIRCYGSANGEYFLGVGGTLMVDSQYREESRNVLQIVQRFGIDNCPEVIRRAYRAGGASLQGEFVVAHAIEPNFPINKPGSARGQIWPVPAAFVWREVYWLRGQRCERELSRAGFHERPFVALRWGVASNDAYGHGGPGMDTLGDIMQLQVETRRKAEYLEKGVRPPMKAPPEMKNEPNSTNPGAITYMTEMGKFEPVFQVDAAWMNPIVADLKDIQQRIKIGYYEDILMAISSREGVQPLNELELTQRDLERLQVLGPFVELFETEVGDPTIIRVLSILQRKGLLDPMPASLRGVPLKIKYTSILSIAQQKAQAAEVKDLLNMGASASAAAKAAGEPDPLRILDLDKMLRQYAETSGQNAGLVRPEAQVKQMDAQRAKQAQAMQALQATQAGVDAAKTLSETSIAPGSALTGGAGAR